MKSTAPYHTDFLLTTVTWRSKNEVGRSDCVLFYYQVLLVGCPTHLLRPSNDVRGTTVEIGVPTDVGRWSEQICTDTGFS
jgi:hypothetical protein